MRVFPVPRDIATSLVMRKGALALPRSLCNNFPNQLPNFAMIAAAQIEDHAFSLYVTHREGQGRENGCDLGIMACAITAPIRNRLFVHLAGGGQNGVQNAHLWGRTQQVRRGT